MILQSATIWLSDISASGTVWPDCVAESFGLILTLHGVDDDEETHDDQTPAERAVKDIRRASRELHSSEEKIWIVLTDLRGEDSIAELCRKEGIAQNL